MDGMYKVELPDAEAGAMVSFMLKMGEGDDAMAYDAMPANEVMVGMPFDVEPSDLMAFTSDDARPATPAPTKTEAEQMREAMRGERGRPRPRWRRRRRRRRRLRRRSRRPWLRRR